MNPQAMKIIVLCIACLLGMCHAAAHAAAPYSVFWAELAPIDTAASSPTGVVYIFVTPTGLMGAGDMKGLEQSVVSTDCTENNCAGVHVHSGTACTGSDVQGGHYMVEGGTDPWTNIRYDKTSSTGAATFNFIVTTTAKTVLGKPFIVHKMDGGRVACGVLKAAPASAVLSAVLEPLGTNTAAGEVTFATSTSYIYGAGHATNLEQSLDATGSDCDANNGCGVHIHDGTACTDNEKQGGHWYTGTVTDDPWKDIIYKSTDSTGKAEFIFLVQAGSIECADKPFIVHKNDGSRVACGLIQAAGGNAQGLISSAQVNAGIGYLWAVSSFALLARLWS